MTEIHRLRAMQPINYCISHSARYQGKHCYLLLRCLLALATQGNHKMAATSTSVISYLELCNTSMRKTLLVFRCYRNESQLRFKIKKVKKWTEKDKTNDAFSCCLLLHFFFFFWLCWYSNKCQYPAILGLNFLTENCVIGILIVVKCRLYVVLVCFWWCNDSPYYSKTKEGETLLHIPQWPSGSLLEAKQWWEM